LITFNDGEFVIIADNKSLKYKNSASQFGVTFLQNLNKAFHINEKKIDFSVSINLSFFPLANMNAATISEDIDIALLKARKASGALHKSA